MSQQVIETSDIGYGTGLGEFFDFYVSNTFYLLAPPYYYTFYSIYLNRCLAVYDGWQRGYHNVDAALVPQRMLQSITTGLNNMLFAHGIDFSGDNASYQFAIKWAERAKLYLALKKAHKFAIAGGTSLIKLNRQNKELFLSAHRIDTFFADIDSTGKITSVRTFFDVIHNTNSDPNKKNHYGLCEERYFNEEGKPCIKATIYLSVSNNLQNEAQNRLDVQSRKVNWQNLPPDIRQYVKKNYPNIIVDEEQYLPFPNSLGCYLMRFTEDIPQIPNTPFGQPIGDILITENYQYDQMKYFEKMEVHMARARAALPEPYWNKDDPENSQRNLDANYFQKIGSISDDADKITALQFLLRGNDIRTQMENIYKDCAFKLNVSASSVASFLSEGAGARTATEIISERTKSDTWIKGQINLNSPEINQMLKDAMYYYNNNPVQIIMKAEDQSPFIERLKTNSDVLSAGNMSPRLFVKTTYKNLSQQEQEEEIAYLEKTRATAEAVQTNGIIQPNLK